MATYEVTLPSTALTLKDNVNRMIVTASSSADALAAAAAYYRGDSPWAQATATAIAEVAVTATGALTGWRFTIKILDTTTPKVFTITSTGAAQDTLDEMGTALATLINLDADIAGAAYNTTTQVLIVALGGGNDDLGDKTLEVTVYAPTRSDSRGRQDQDVHHPGFIASTTEGQTANDNLEVTFAADTLVVPTVESTGKA